MGYQSMFAVRRDIAKRYKQERRDLQGTAMLLLFGLRPMPE
jgi:hypothetical protein